MLNRATTLLVVLAIFVWGTPVLQAQSLSSEQKAKLDARFERIVQKANQGTLEAEIDRFEKQLERARQEADAERKNAFDGQTGEVNAAADVTTRSSGKAPLTPRNLTPTVRTAEGTPVYDAIVHTGTPSALESRGIRVVSSFEKFSTVRATPAELQTLSRLGTVDRIVSPKRVQPQNDEAAAEAGVRTLNNGIGGTKYTGKDVMTCVIDSGIDWDHPDFTNENGQSRIRYIWDHTEDVPAVGTPDGNDASRFGPNFNPKYGDEYRPSDIQSGNVQEEDTDGHGTHVTGTVASSGNAYEQSNGVEKYKGMAPDANIISVKTSFSGNSIIDGINYCKNVAADEGKPVVVNMSLGSNFAPHDGTSVLATAANNLTEGGSASGMAVVTSAGNNGGDPPAHTGPKSLSNSVDVGIDIPSYSSFLGTMNTNLWVYEGGAYNVSVYSPNMEDTLTVNVEEGTAPDSTLETPGGETIRFNSGSPVTSSARFFQVYLIDPAEGEWTVRIRAEGDQPTQDVHGWLGSSPYPIEGATWTDADSRYTISSPATSPGVIAVGSYTHRTRWSTTDGVGSGFPTGAGVVRDSISSFSSRGPTVDGRDKPDVAAPGQLTASAFSGDASSPLINDSYVVDSQHQLVSGTSMAAPVVSGIVALLMQEDPTLSTADARSLLSETARVDEAVERRGANWNEAFGHGKVNALGALTRLRQGGQGAPSMEVLSYHDEPFLFDTSNPSTPDYTASDTLGGANGADSLALRFSPTTGGFVTGAHLSVAGNDGFSQAPDGSIVYSDTANTLTEPLRVQVYTDDDGTPGTAVGNPVEVPPSKLASFQSNFVSFDGAAASVEAGTNYHLVVTTDAEEQGRILMLAETKGQTAGRSMMRDGSSWTATGNDLVMRAQVSADVFPPAAVAGLNVPTAEPENVELSWDGLEEADQYHVYRDTEPVPKSATGQTPLAMVESGTTTYTDDEAATGQTYYYRVAAVNEDGNRGEASSEAEVFLYPENVTADASVSFGDEAAGSTAETFRLVALPGQAGQPVEGTLNGEAGLDWQAYAVDQSGVTAFDESDAFTFEAGNGFWLSSTSTWNSSGEHSTVDLSAEDGTAATVDLHNGWNLISNPTDKHVPFSMIQAAHSDTLQVLMAFDGTWHVADTMKSASTGVAYYFNNTEGLSELKIPYPGAPGVDQKAAPKKKQEAPLLALSARAPVENSPASTVKVGFSAGASNGLDARDQFAPTGRFEPVSLRLEASEQGRSLLLEQRSSIEESARSGHTFDLQLDSDVSGPVQISARNLERVKGYEVALLDPSTGTTHDLRHSGQVTVNSDGGTTSLKLAVGSQAYVDGQAENIVPEEVALSSYPNPFREQGTIEYALPDEQEVRLVLYDVLGRKVGVLESGRKDAGTHTVRMDGDELASGIYFGRLEAGDKQLTQKITVVR